MKKICISSLVLQIIILIRQKKDEEIIRLRIKYESSAKENLDKNVYAEANRV